MSRRVGARIGTWVLAALILTTATATAQSVSATTGALNGRVVDASAALLPGVTVTATSPALQGPRTGVTNEEGTYRFIGLPPGVYTVQYELAAFGVVVREGINIGVGFTASVNVELKLASLQETVTVSGASPVVDVTSTRTATIFESKQLEALPNARDFWSIMAQTPAMQVQRIDVGGSTAGTQTGYSAYDTKADQHRPMIEGIVNTEGTSAAGFYYDYGAFDEVSVGTGTSSAEMPWPGVLSQFVSKSGGNTYHGRLYADYESPNVQSTNIDAAQIALGLKGSASLPASDLNKMHSYYDLNGDIGGFLKRDTVWWYGSLRSQDIQTLLPNFPVKPFETGLRNASAKVTYALNKNNKLVGYGMWGRKYQPNRLDTYLIAATSAIHNSADSTLLQKYWGHTYKAEWDSIVSDHVFFEVHGGQFGYDWPYTRYSNSPAFQDLSTNVVSGGNQDGWWTNRRRNQVFGTLSVFKDGWAGSHNFKMGGEVFDEATEYKRGDGGVGNVPGDVLQVLRNGVPSEVLLFQSPVDSLDGLRTFGLYITDTWRASSKLTLSLGLRFDRYRSYLPAQAGPPVGPFNTTQVNFAAIDNLLTWNLPAPRLGFTYDLLGTGKTVLKGNYAQYYWNPGTAVIAENVNNNPVDWYNRYNWADKNGNGVWDAGEQGLLTASRGGVGSAILDPAGLNDTLTREAAAWVEHELVPNVGIHAGFVWRRISGLVQLNNANRPFSAFTVPTTILDPGPDGVLKTADDGASIAGYNLSAAALALPVLNELQNTSGKDDFYTLEFSASKRATGRWSLSGSFSYRWNQDNSASYFGNSLRGLQDVATPNDLINTDNGRYNFTTWAFKVNGTYEAKYGIRITPSLRNQSGQPYGRTISAAAANGINYGTARILVEPIDTHRQDNVTILDVRVEKAIKLGSQTLSGFIDGYNLSNSNAATNINWSSGATYLTPSTIIGPRLARIGVKFDW
ncbi:MAG TPA: carboxypeptidase regulatory-like domain-containing protein [Vicinamibacterales bacterium]